MTTTTSTRTRPSRLLLIGVLVAALVAATVATTTAVAGRADGAIGQDASGGGWGNGGGNGNGNGGRDIDEQAVLRTLFQWSEGYDENEPELMRDAFTQDARFVYSSPAFTEPLVFEGIDAVMKLFTDSLAAQNDQRRHVDTNSQVHEVDRRTVQVTTYLTLLVVADPAGSPFLQSTGVYRDTLVLERDGQWRIKERNLTLDTAA